MVMKKISQIWLSFWFGYLTYGSLNLVLGIHLNQNLRGVAARETLSVPGSASNAGMAPSICGSFESTWVWTNFFPRFVIALAIAEWSVERLASWWKTLRLRMMVYTKLELPEKQAKGLSTTMKWMND